MKKTLLLAATAAVILTTASCSTISNTATTKTVDTELYNRASADLVVSEKIVSYTLYPTKAQRNGGEGSVKAAAVAKCLEENGGADILVAPQYEIKRTRGLFGSKISYVKVSGRPASYTKFHPTSKTEAEVILIAD